MDGLQNSKMKSLARAGAEVCLKPATQYAKGSSDEETERKDGSYHVGRRCVQIRALAGAAHRSA